MKNEDDECFKWCIKRALNTVKSHPERVTSLLREQSKALNWEGIEFPVKLKGTNTIHLFEMKNLGVVVTYLVMNAMPESTPLRKIDSIGTAGTVNLLLSSTDET